VTCNGLTACSNWHVQCGSDHCAVDCTGIAQSGFTLSAGASCQFDQTNCPP